MEVDMRKLGNLLLGAVIGGLVGSGLALLFAPASGDETRREIEVYFKNIKADVIQAAEEKRAELEAQLAKLRSGEDVTIEEKKA
jgi:gas vesicle protein